MRQFSRATVLTLLCLTASVAAAQHDIEDRFVGMKVQLPGDWTNTTATLFGVSEAPFKSAHQKYSIEESDQSALLPFEDVTIYQSSYENSAEYDYSGYVAFFAEEGRCYQVEVASPEPFASEQPFFAATLGSLMIRGPLGDDEPLDSNGARYK